MDDEIDAHWLINDFQNTNSDAWRKLCEYIDLVADAKEEKFNPVEYLGNEHYLEIFTLPPSIAKLKRVKILNLYGSRIRILPPEIGEMESLEEFDPYTSCDLRWFPYEITRCRRLKDTCVSTRMLYGNFKTRAEFPSLVANPVRYSDADAHCSICNVVIPSNMQMQFWISLLVGKDVLPLLVNSCSDNCTQSLPKPPRNYIETPHKGGNSIVQPLGYYQLAMNGDNQPRQSHSNATRLIANAACFAKKLLQISVFK